MAESQKQRNIGNVSSEVNRLNNQWKLIDAYYNFAAVRKILSGSAGWTSDSLCKGPPGQPLARGHPPQPIAVSRSSPRSTCRGKPPEFIEAWPEFIEGGSEFIEAWPEFIEGQPGVSKKTHSLTTTNFYKQNSNDKQILFFKNLLIFKIMKKRILFLAFLITVLFTGMKSYAQLNTEEDYLTGAPATCATAVPLSCGSADALHPAPGVSYEYTITSSSAGTVHWFVTDDASVMATGAIAAAIEPADGSSPYVLTADAAYNNAANTSLTVNVTWKSFDGNANNVILVAYNIDAAGCTNNIEAYRIKPLYQFTLDLAGILDNGAAGATECVAPIVSANYDGTNLTVDYGMNYVFFTVNAANWMTSWRPENFSATSSDPASTIGTIEWALPANATTGGAWNTVGTGVVLATDYASNVNGFIGATGECIIVRVPVTHASATETLANETINLVVNGQMINPQTAAFDGLYPDLDEGGAGNPCTDDLVTDNADYVITPRPTITETTPTPFENKVP